jgi:hypothetical protein
VVSNHAERSPKTLSPLSRIGSQDTRFRRPTIPTHDARCKMGYGKPIKQHKALEPGGKSDLCYVSLERTDLTGWRKIKQRDERQTGQATAEAKQPSIQIH